MTLSSEACAGGDTAARGDLQLPKQTAMIHWPGPSWPRRNCPCYLSGRFHPASQPRSSEAGRFFKAHRPERRPGLGARVHFCCFQLLTSFKPGKGRLPCGNAAHSHVHSRYSEHNFLFLFQKIKQQTFTAFHMTRLIFFPT